MYPCDGEHGSVDANRYDSEGLVRLDEAECWAFLRAHRLGRIALIQYERPLIFPVNYAVDGDTVVFRTARGSKLTAAGREASVVFEVDDVDDDLRSGTSVLVHGTLDEISAPEDRALASSLSIDTWAPGERDHVVRVTPQWLTGRRVVTEPEQLAHNGTDTREESTT